MEDLRIAKEILNQLKVLGGVKVWSWGANGWVGGANYLTFKVQGFKLKGHVTITLNSSDLYNIEFRNRKNEIIKTINDIFFDEMVNIIDHEVETDNGKYTPEQENKIRKGFGL